MALNGEITMPKPKRDYDAQIARIRELAKQIITITDYPEPSMTTWWMALGDIMQDLEQEQVVQ